jgi:hypothetical protein
MKSLRKRFGSEYSAVAEEGRAVAARFSGRSRQWTGSRRPASGWPQRHAESGTGEMTTGMVFQRTHYKLATNRIGVFIIITIVT